MTLERSRRTACSRLCRRKRVVTAGWKVRPRQKKPFRPEIVRTLTHPLIRKEHRYEVAVLSEIWVYRFRRIIVRNETRTLWRLHRVIKVGPAVKLKRCRTVRAPWSCYRPIPWRVWAPRWSEWTLFSNCRRPVRFRACRSRSTITKQQTLRSLIRSKLWSNATMKATMKAGQFPGLPATEWMVSLDRSLW